MGFSGRKTPYMADTIRSAAMPALRPVQQRLGFQIALQRAALLAALLVWEPLAVVVLDHVVPGGLPRPILIGASVGWALALVGGFAGYAIWAWLRPVGAAFAARQIEQAAAVPHNPVLNAVFLTREPQFAYATDAAAFPADRVIAAHGDAAVATDERRALRWGLLLGSVAGWLLLIVLSPKSVWISLGRFLGMDLPAPTATQVELIRPRADEVFHVGDPIPFGFAVQGRPVERMTLEFLDGPGPNADVRSRTELPRAAGARGRDERHHILAPAEVSGDLFYRARAGDGELRGRVDVHPRPELLMARVRVDPPLGPALDPAARSGPDSGHAGPGGAPVQENWRTGEPWEQDATEPLIVLPESRVTLSITANGAIRDPVLVFRTGHAAPSRSRMQINPRNPAGAELAWVPLSSGQYRVEFADEWGALYDRARFFELTVVAPVDAASGESKAGKEEEAQAETRSEPPPESKTGRGDQPQPGGAQRTPAERGSPESGEDSEPPENTSDNPQTSGGDRVGDTGRDSADDEHPDQRGSTSASLPDSDPGDGQPGEQSPEPGSAPGESGEQGYEEALRKFSEEHGEDAREVARKLAEGERQSPGEPTESDRPAEAPAPDAESTEPQAPETPPPASQPSAESQPAGESPENGEQNDDDAAPESESGPESEAHDEGEQAPSDSGAPGNEGAPNSGEPGPENENPGQGESSGDPQGGGQPGDGNPGDLANSDGQPRDGAGSEGPGAPGSTPGSGQIGGSAEQAAEELLSRLDDNQPLDEQTLLDMGFSPDRAKAFLEALARLQALRPTAASSDQSLKHRELDVALGSGEVEEGSARAAAGGNTDSAVDHTDDDLLTGPQPDARRAPAHLRRVLEQYYRSLARSGAAPASQPVDR